MLEEMVYRERVRAWKVHEQNLFRELYQRYGEEKDFENLHQVSTDIMHMSLHREGAYNMQEKPPAEPVEQPRTDADILALLDDLPEF